MIKRISEWAADAKSAFNQKSTGIDVNFKDMDIFEKDLMLAVIKNEISKNALIKIRETLNAHSVTHKHDTFMRGYLEACTSLIEKIIEVKKETSPFQMVAHLPALTSQNTVINAKP